MYLPSRPHTTPPTCLLTEYFNLWIIVNMSGHQQKGSQNQCNEFSCFKCLVQSCDV